MKNLVAGARVSPYMTGTQRRSSKPAPFGLGPAAREEPTDAPRVPSSRPGASGGRDEGVRCPGGAPLAPPRVPAGVRHARGSLLDRRSGGPHTPDPHAAPP